MDNSPITFTSLALCVLLMAMVVMFICHCLGPRTNSWMRSNKEEKIGLSKNKLFHANGYMIHSGSDFLLSTSGSFKRFDTVDKDDHNYSGPPLQTTPLWNLPQTDCNIPPQPLRPAPAPGSTKTVTFSLHEVNEITSPLENNLRRSNTLVSCMRSSVNKNSSSKILQPIDAPPPPRLSSSSSMLCATAIPRPITKRQISLQNTICLNDENMTKPHHKENSVSSNEEQQQQSRTLKRHNSSTNPFLCESLESLPEKYEPSTALQMHKNYYSNNNNNKSNGNSKDANVNAVNCVNTKNDNLSTNGSNNPFHDNSNCVFSQLDVIAPVAADINNASKIQSTTVDNLRPEMNSQQQKMFNFKNSVNPLVTAKKIFKNPQQFRNRSFSESEASPETTDVKTLSSKLATAGLRKPSNTTNPFTGLSQKVKGPHMLQKTISEDFLFRKLGVNHVLNGGATSGGTWSFGRGLMRQNSASNLGQRNNSQCSLDSIALGSIDGINLEHAISCDSVNSDSSLFLPDLDQPYTQITGYLCIGLQYDKNSPTEDGMDLTVQVLEAKGLICPLNVESLDTFVRIYLVPDQAGAMQTKVFKNSGTPHYNEAFNFWLKRQYRRHSLWFHLYHNGDAHTLIGEAEME
ncbi:probable serine/threonine-protein kinase DDB_G0276461, partial [Teleopsis dalmanni]